MAPVFLRLLGSLCKIITYKLFRSSFQLIQSLVWRLTGTRAARLRYESESDDACAVHILNILARNKLDPLAPATLEDFITTHDSFEEIHRLLNTNVSLYALTDTEAIFVETPAEIDIYSSEVSSFMYTAQYEHAKKVLKVRHSTLHLAASLMGSLSGTVVFLSNTGRCGSTLLARMFGATGQALSLCEPDAVFCLNNLAKSTDLLRSCIRVLCKQTKPGIKYYLIKPRSQANALVPTLVKEMPQVKVLFMYRQGFATLKSCYLAYDNLVILNTLRCILAIPVKTIRQYLLRLLMPGCDVFAQMRSILEVYLWLTNTCIEQYLQMRRDGIQVPAVRYEHLVETPLEALAAIFQHCGIPEDLVSQASTPISVDSQELSVLAKKLNSEYKRLAYNSEFKVICDAICDQQGVPRLDDPSDLPGTITGKDASQIQ